MKRVELLTVTDCFYISGRGVILLPDFSVPSGHWADREESVTVEMPGGQSFETTARFNLSHLNISGAGVPIDRRWRMTVLLPDGTDVHVGSKILVSHEVRELLFPKIVASSWQSAKR